MLYKLSNSCLTDILVALIMLAVLFLPAESFFLSFLTGSCTGVHERSAAHNFVGLCAKGTPERGAQALMSVKALMSMAPHTALSACVQKALLSVALRHS